MTLTQQAHACIQGAVSNEKLNTSVAIDMTCGNGFDTQFLCVTGFARVIGVDIQAKAITATHQRLTTAGFNFVELHQNSHANIDQIINTHIDCAMFNFGYLPHGDKTISTVRDTSLIALEKTFALLSTKSMVTALCYPGHTAGKVETQAIESYLSQLPITEFSIEHRAAKSKQEHAPRLYIIRRNLPSKPCSINLNQ